MTSCLRQGLDKQTGMVDNFPKTLSTTAGVKHFFEMKTLPKFPLFSQRTLMLSELYGLQSFALNF